MGFNLAKFGKVKVLKNVSIRCTTVQTCQLMTLLKQCLGSIQFWCGSGSWISTGKKDLLIFLTNFFQKFRFGVLEWKKFVFFCIFWLIFYPLDPDPGSQNLADPDPKHCLNTYLSKYWRLYYFIYIQIFLKNPANRSLFLSFSKPLPFLS